MLLIIIMLPQEHPEDRRLLLDVSATCREMQARVLELVGLVQHRDLTASLLELNDQMNNQLLRCSAIHIYMFPRFERYKNNTSAEIGAAKSPGSSDEAFSPDEVNLSSWYTCHLILSPGALTDPACPCCC